MMAAAWIDPPHPALPLALHLGDGGREPLAELDAALETRRLLHPKARGGHLELHTGRHRIGVSGLIALRERLEAAGYTAAALVSTNPHTRVAAAAIGLVWRAPAPCRPGEDQPGGEAEVAGFSLHRGTLRSGDQLAAAGSILVLGDVNPGARIVASGHVLVWGRMRGMAHAGCAGDTRARIVALQLRPVQLRIADVVARGPEEPPPPGLAEEARLVDGVIRIDAASPIWPLND